MFNIDSKPVFRETVRVPIAGIAGSTTETFQAAFRLLDIAVFTGFDLSDPAGVRGLLEQAIVGLDDIVDEAGAAVPYDDALRDRLIGKLNVRMALVAAYVEGSVRVAQGN